MMSARDGHHHSSSDAGAGVRPPGSQPPGRGPPDKSQRALASSSFFPRRRAHALENGRSYLVTEKRPDVAFAYLEDAIKKGLPSLVVTRQHPKLVRPERGLMDVRILWLSHTPGEDYQSPTDLGSLSKAIRRFIEENNGEGVVLLDGLEFLIVSNGFLQTLTFVEHVNEFIMRTHGILLLPVDPECLDAKELALLQRNLPDLSGPRPILFIPRTLELLKECETLQARVGVAWSAIDASPHSFEEKLRNARRAETPFIVVIGGGETKLGALDVIQADGSEVWMTIDGLIELVRGRGSAPQ